MPYLFALVFFQFHFDEVFRVSQFRLTRNNFQNSNIFSSSHPILFRKSETNFCRNFKLRIFLKSLKRKCADVTSPTWWSCHWTGDRVARAIGPTEWTSELQTEVHFYGIAPEFLTYDIAPKYISLVPNRQRRR